MRRYRRVIFSGTRHALSAVDADRVLRLVTWAAERADEMSVGDCPTGVDELVYRLLGDRARVFRADWDAHGRAAGPKRNGEMVRWAAEVRPSLLVAFPAPGGRGTRDCIGQAVDAGLHVIVEPVGVRP